MVKRTYTIRNPGKAKHLVISPEDHDAVKLFARKNHITIAESAHRLLEIGFAVVIKGLSNYR